MDRRFEELRDDRNKRFEQLAAFIWILVAIFISLTVFLTRFAYWDRRIIIRKARDEAAKAIEKEGRLQDLVLALRKPALEDPKLA